MKAFVGEHWRALIAIFLMSLIVRALTGYFLATHINDAGWFPFGIYKFFHEQAVGIVEGSRSAFWISGGADPTPAVYPPGYSLWLTVVFGLTGSRSIILVQVLQIILDAASVWLVVGIGTAAYRWSVGLWAGIAAAISPLLAFYGASPLADAPTTWIVLGAILCLVFAYKSADLRFALAAGALLGLSCWFRANGLLLAFVCGLALFVLCRSVWPRRAQLALTVIFAAILVIAPIVIRNSVAFNAFVPTGLGVGTNLWEGVGETDRAEEFGAILGDDKLAEQERIEQGLGDGPDVTLYRPNGVERDRARAKRALGVIAQHPVWYAGVMAKRMWGLLKYAGEPSGIYGSAGINITAAKSLPEQWRFPPLSTVVTLFGWMQSLFRYLALPLMIIGIILGFREERRVTILLMGCVLYYLVFGAFLHSEIRYSLPMQATLLVFTGQAMATFGKLARAKIRK